ncbi:hypothetical protein [Leptospira sp. GIMC2001]|uniref:hypothetical protein n=1 Tax=Leptospira sp. GIMC2001 TaxID=1513297 RepID=UPI00234BF43D|nr:hypothetical protein [Leptospira sp. GIMC2001]WCL48931.1 hypothetical protein O4O04_16780 [Leptospira sp. GIMC2001]
MKTPIDFGKLPPLKFQTLFLLGLLVFTIIVIYLFPSVQNGFFLCLGFQTILFEAKFILFRIYGAKSGLGQAGLILLSFFGSLAILVIGMRDGGSEFILGFFLAYFGFLAIFVFVAVWTKDNHSLIIQKEEEL